MRILSPTRACDLRQVPGFPASVSPSGVCEALGLAPGTCRHGMLAKATRGPAGEAAPSPLSSPVLTAALPTPSPPPAPHKPPQHHLLGDGMKSRSSERHLGTQPGMPGSQAPPSRCPSSRFHTWAPACLCQGQPDRPSALRTPSASLGHLLWPPPCWFPPPVQPGRTHRSCSAWEGACGVSLPQGPGKGSK